MKLNIEVDDGTLAQIVSDEIQRLDEKTVHDIAVAALKAFFSDPNNAERLVIQEVNVYNRITQLNPLVEDMLKSAVKPDDVREFVELIMKTARENHYELVRDTMLGFFTRNLFSHENQMEFYNSIVRSMEGGK